MSFRSAALTRARIVASAVAVGLLVGAAATLVLSASRPTASARSMVLSLGALAFGFGLLGRSSSILLERGIENAQRHLDTGTSWDESDSRRAMARAGSFGAGVMVAVPTVGAGVGPVVMRRIELVV